MQKTQNVTYRGSGVNLELGNTASEILYNASKETWKNRRGKIGEVEEFSAGFSSLRAIGVGGVRPSLYMMVNSDGVGTKIEIAERLADHRTVAYDLLAMVCDDAAIRGIEPALVSSVLDINVLGKDNDSYIRFIRELACGYIGAAEMAGVAVINGEIAELGARVQGYGQFNYNWSATAIGFASKENLIDCSRVTAGDYLVGLREDGFRSNGLSLARKIFGSHYGENWHLKVGNEPLKPSTIYTKVILDIARSTEVHGMAHITGGGIPEKLGRMLRPSGKGACIERPFDPPRLMASCQQIGNIADHEAYKVWNMGHGIIIATNKPYDAIGIAERRGITASVIGRVVHDPGISIVSHGTEKFGQLLRY